MHNTENKICQPYFTVAATTLKSKLKDPIDTDYFKSETLL